MLVRPDTFGNEAQAFYQSDQKSLSRANVSPGLKDVLNKEAVLDDGPPVPVRPARGLDDDFVQVLDAAGMRLPSPPNVGDHRAELDGLAPDRVARNVHATV